LVVNVPYRVIYGDTDQMEFMYYANHLRLFEMARNEYMRATGLTYRQVEDRGFFLPVTEVNCRYRKAIRYDDLITVKTWVTRAKGVRVTFRYEIVSEAGEVLADGVTEHAAVNAEGRPVRLDPDILTLLSPVES